MNSTTILYLAEDMIKRAEHVARDTTAGIVGAEAGGLGGLTAGGIAGAAYADKLDPVVKGFRTLRPMHPNAALDEINLSALGRQLQLTGRGGAIGAGLGLAGGAAGAIALARRGDHSQAPSKLQQLLDMLRSRKH